MINIDSKQGIFSMDGSGVELLAELTKVMRTMYQQGLLTEDRLNTILALVVSSDKEILRTADDIKKNKDIFSQIFEDLL